MKTVRKSSASCRLDDETLARLDRLAAARACSRADILCAAVTFGLPLLEHNQSVDVRRLIVLAEYAAAALTEMVQRHDPDAPAELLQLAEKRAANDHG